MKQKIQDEWNTGLKWIDPKPNKKQAFVFFVLLCDESDHFQWKGSGAILADRRASCDQIT